MYELELSVVAHRLSVEAEKKDFFPFSTFFGVPKRKEKEKRVWESTVVLLLGTFPGLEKLQRKFPLLLIVL